MIYTKDNEKSSYDDDKEQVLNKLLKIKSLLEEIRDSLSEDPLNEEDNDNSYKIENII